LSIKGVGDAAINEMCESRPYKSIEDMLWNADGSWRHSKFNKRALESLICIGAFDSFDCVGHGKIFENYKQMHEILINRNGDIKKRTKKNPLQGIENFKSLLIETAGMSDWTKNERVNNSMKYLGSFDMASLVPDELKTKLCESGIKPISDLCNNDIYWFLVVKSEIKFTKNGKSYLFLTVTGTDGKNKRIFCWGWNVKSDPPPAYSLCAAEIVIDDFGLKTFQNKIKILRP